MRIILAIALLCGLVTSALSQSIQTGDTLDISVWQDSKLDRRVVVSQSGMISFPLAGHIRAKGLTAQALEDVLRSKLKNSFTDRLDITVALVASRQEDDTKPRVYVTGEVLRPGPYVLVGKITVMQAITLAGGLGPFAARHRVQVHRKVQGSESVFVFDYGAFESRADLDSNIEVKGGDIIVVPERGLISGIFRGIFD
jgi:polysaccharide export outer membrane protein